MTSADDLDRIWREGLTLAASELVVRDDPRARTATRVQRRRRSRRIKTAVAAIAFSVAAIGATAHFDDHVSHGRVASRPPTTVQASVSIDDAPGNQLAITFPGRTVSGNPPSVTLPAGIIHFEIHGTPAHQLVIDGVPDFTATFAGTASSTVTENVRLQPGRYSLHCTIPGHAAAGEQAILTVEAQAG